MSQPTQTEPNSAATPRTLESIFPFLPRVFSSQSALPDVVAEEQKLVNAITASDGVLDAAQRLQLMHAATPDQAGPPHGLDPVLETFGAKLSSSAVPLSPNDIA